MPPATLDVSLVLSPRPVHSRLDNLAVRRSAESDSLHAAREFVHVGEPAVSRLLRVVCPVADGIAGVPRHRRACPTTFEANIVQESAPKGVESEHVRVAHDDEQRLRACHGDCGHVQPSFNGAGKNEYVPLKRRGLATNPSVCRRSYSTNSRLLRTVEMMITRRSCPWNSSTLPTFTWSATPRSELRILTT
jgi:hypothetical protein